MAKNKDTQAENENVAAGTADNAATTPVAVPASEIPTNTAPAIASLEENQALTHSDPNAPETTRDDGLDAGVPMIQGSPSERQGPEDALGFGPKRGDYTSRVGPADYNPHISVYDPETGRTRLVPQRELAQDIGDTPGKGGVDTAQASGAYAVPGGYTTTPVEAIRPIGSPDAASNEASAYAPATYRGMTEFELRERGLAVDGSPLEATATDAQGDAGDENDSVVDKALEDADNVGKGEGSSEGANK